LSYLFAELRRRFIRGKCALDSQLIQCDVPRRSRIVWGTADTIFSSKSPEYLDRIFGASRGVRLLPGRKLFWPEEHPEVIVEEALRLWRAA